MTTRETLSRLRDVMARELETISMYESYAEAETDPQMKTLFQHLADEEKEHVTECYEALLVHDPVQKKWSDSGAHAQAIREQRFGAEAAARPAVAMVSPEAPAPAATPALTPRPPASSPVVPAPSPPSRPAGKGSGIRPTPPTIGSLFGTTQE